MKKYIVATILIFAVAVSGLIFTFTEINSNNDTVTITENIKFGDVSAAKGITVTSKNDYAGRLIWKTICEVGNSENAITEYNYYSSELQEIVKTKDYSFSVDMDIRYGYNMYTPYEELDGMEKLFTDLYNKCPINGRIDETVYLKDVYDYYPVRIYADLKNVYWSNNDYEYLFSDEKGGEKYVTNKFREYFKIPVFEEYAIDIHITRSGNSSSLGTSERQESMAYDYYFGTKSACTEDTVFFTIRNKTYQNIPVDMSLVPGGYGIYSFKYSDGTNHENTGIDADSLATVYALDPEATVESMVISKDGKDLIIVETKGENSIFTVIDIETMTKKHEVIIENFLVYDDYTRYNELAYIASGSKDYHYTESGLKESEEFYILLCSDRFALIDKDYELQFVGTRMNYIDESFCYMDYNSKMVYDGERLIIVDSITRDNYSINYCGYYMAVYTEEGLTYYAEYESSLDANKNYNQYSYNCYPYGSAYSISLEN